MGKRQVNIFLPLHVPEYSVRQAYVMEVLKLLQWWHGHEWLSIIPQCLCRLKRRKVRRPCRLRWTTRPDLTHGKFVVDHGLWCHVCGHNAPRNTSKCQSEWSSEGLEAEEEQFLLLECAQELIEPGYAKLELGENYGQAMQA